MQTILKDNAYVYGCAQCDGRRQTISTNDPMEAV